MQKFGLPSNIRLGNYLNIYHHLKDILPQFLLQFQSAKADVDLDIGSQICYSEAREAKKQLRSLFEGNAVHVTCERGKAKPNQLKEILNDFLRKYDIPVRNVLAEGQNAILQIDHHPDANMIVRKLQMKQIDGLVLSATKVQLKTLVEKKNYKHVDIKEVNKISLACLEDLEEKGFFKLLNSNAKDSVLKNEQVKKSSVKLSELLMK